MNLRWSPQAIGTVAAGLAIGAAGAYLQRPLLVLAATMGLIAVVLDAALTLGARPRVTLDVNPLRIPEDELTTVSIDANLGGRQQARVDLSSSLQLVDGSNILQHGQSHFQVRCPVRGPQAIGPVQVRTWGPLRLWARQEEVSPAATVDVIPRSESVEEVRLVSKVVTPVQGRYQVNRPGQGFDFFTLREYHSGDTMRSINWKATARRDDLIVNQRQTETLGEVAILLDARSVMGLGHAGQTPLDRGCRVALGIFEEALGNRDEVSLLAYGEAVHEVVPIRTDRLSHAEDLLASLPARGDKTADAAWAVAQTKLRSRTGPIILITSAEADPTLASTIQGMAGQGHQVIVISPQPTDDAFPKLRSQRGTDRTTVLERLREAGAAVFDWQPHQAVA